MAPFLWVIQYTVFMIMGACVYIIYIVYLNYLLILYI